MAEISPAVLSVGFGLRIIDFEDKELTGQADVTGTCLLQTDQLASDHYMRVERIVVQGPSANTCIVTVYVGDRQIPQRGRDWTPLPPGAIGVSEYPSYLTVKPTTLLTIAITGAVPNDRFFASVQFQLVQKVLGQGRWPSS